MRNIHHAPRKKESVTELCNVAAVLGDGMGSAVVPVVVGIVVTGQVVKALSANLSGVWVAAMFIGGASAGVVVLMRLFAAVNGWRYLRAIERDFGVRTRQHVLHVINGAKKGERLS
jgi:hypothetical protein